MSLPPRTPEQRADALEKAAQARRDKSAALAEITAGTLPVAAVLAGEDPRLLKAKVRRVLLAVPGIGNARADQLMAGAGIGPARSIKGLGSAPRQRAALTEQLAAWLQLTAA